RQSNGAIFIAGEFTSVDGTNRNRIARLHANGSLDILFDPGAGANLTVRAVAAQVDGKVLIAGDFVTVNGTNRNSIARLNVNGSVDATFNPGTGANNPIESISLQPDGKLLVAGQFTSINGTNRNRIARLHADGSLDLSFSPGTGADGIVFSVAVQADGKVLLGGDFFSFAGASRTHIARLNTNGSLDATFNPTARANDTVSSVAVSADGKLFVGGFFNTVNGIGRSGIARLEGDAPLPALNISLANAILISWPIAFTNFTLQTTTNVAEPNSWADVPGMPAIVGDRLISTNTLDSANTFFRLKSLIDASVQR
ncbi:MAG TPA: delta-60 repeat domain-containing protein, partial [Candidatus Limnocylindria bacterium]|nr:delta-60 repeat domain-containing protein [Candidatus Limnocylindria bacterium]